MSSTFNICNSNFSNEQVRGYAAQALDMGGKEALVDIFLKIVK